MNEVEELENQTNCTKKEEPAIAKPSVDFGTATEQIERLIQPHYEWINLNPFTVLQLSIDATDEDIKQHYRKLSTLVHPDKSQHYRARDAFEQVKKAHSMLLDLDRRKLMVKTIENTIQRVEKERRLKIKKGVKDLEDIELVKQTEIKKAFAEMENRRLNYKKREAAQHKRENRQYEKEKEVMNEDFKKEKAWAQTERRDKRMGHWQDFQKVGKKVKVQGSGWSEEKRNDMKFGTHDGDAYKKKWK